MNDFHQWLTVQLEIAKVRKAINVRAVEVVDAMWGKRDYTESHEALLGLKIRLAYLESQLTE